MIEHENRSKSVSGNKNGMYGKRQSLKVRKDMSVRNSGRGNPMFGKKCTDFMTKEESERWLQNVKNNWSRIPEEKKRVILEKRRITMTGKKWYHDKNNTIELLFGECDVIPDNFIKGRKKK